MATKRNRRSTEERFAKLVLSTKAGLDLADVLLDTILTAAWDAKDKERVYELHKLREDLDALMAKGKDGAA